MSYRDHDIVHGEGFMAGDIDDSTNVQSCKSVARQKFDVTRNFCISNYPAGRWLDGPEHRSLLWRLIYFSPLTPLRWSC